VITSVRPAEYMSAVSKKFTPSSTARRTIGSASSSDRNHARRSLSPKLIIPRQTGDTFSPDAPNRR
jgi:hypothetical protein